MNKWQIKKLINIKNNIELINSIDFRLRLVLGILVLLSVFVVFHFFYVMAPLLTITLFLLPISLIAAFINHKIALYSLLLSTMYIVGYVYTAGGSLYELSLLLLPNIIVISLFILFVFQINYLADEYCKEIEMQSRLEEELTSQNLKLQIYAERLEAEIEEKFTTERTLVKSEEQYRGLVEKAHIAILIDDKDGKLTYFNQQLVSLSQYSYEELYSLSFRELIHHSDYDFVSENHRNRLEGKDHKNHYEFRMNCKDGSIVYLEADISTLRENGVPYGSRAYLWDISDRKKAELALKDSEERFRGIYNNSSLGFYRMKPNGEVVMANPRFLTMLKLDSIDEILNKKISDVLEVDAERDAFFTSIHSEMRINGFECEWYRKDGGLFFGRETAWVILDDDYEILYIDAILEDITARKQVEEEREKLVYLLQTTQSELKVLSGLLPICSSCKKIRDDKGNWAGVEQYIDENSEAEFSHGICPDCAARLYPGYL